MISQKFPSAHQFKEIFFNPGTELFIFTILVVLNSMYLLFYRYLPSLDSPQHLYTSRVLIELIKGNEDMSTFFQINPAIVGYWTTLLILAFLNTLFPAWLTEKMMLLLCLTLVPFAFRYLIRSLRQSVNYAVLLVIPLTQHSFLYMGYFAFSLAWAMLFFTIGYYFRHHGDHNIRKIIVIGGLLLAGFFTHLLTYVFTLFIIGLHQLFLFVLALKEANRQSVLKMQFRKWLKHMLVFLPGLVLAVLYYQNVREVLPYNPKSGYSFMEKADDLVNLSSLVGFSNSEEGLYNRMLFFIISGLGLLTLVSKFYSCMGNRFQKARDITTPFYFWLSLALIVLLFYFMVPISPGTLTMSKRLLLFFLFSYVAVLALSSVPAFLQALAVITVIGYSTTMFQVRSKYYKALDTYVTDLEGITNEMEKNRTFVSIRAFREWNNEHFPLYAGVDKPLIGLQNPQVASIYPLTLNEHKLPVMLAGSYLPPRFGTFWKTGDNQPEDTRTIDYIIIQGYPAFRDYPEFEESKQEIESDYHLVKLSQGGYWALYEIKAN